MKHILFILATFLFLISCQDDNIDLGKPVDESYQLNYPTYFPALTFDTVKYPLTKSGIELGRKLFYEGKLSEIIRFLVLFVTSKKMLLHITDTILVMELTIA